MGTRLYPATKDEAKLERLAGVAPGTAARLREMETRQEAELAAATAAADLSARFDLRYRHWQERRADADVGTYDDFLTFGWGKFNGAGIAEDYSGSLTDPAAVAELFRVNRIDADVALCGGVYWW